MAAMRRYLTVFILTVMVVSAALASEGPLVGENGAYLPFVAHDSLGVVVCPESLHDPTRWHPLIDSVIGCHYRHEHKHDPNQANDIFGPPGAWFGGASISYPWQTTNENEEKHEAYGWIVRRGIPSQGRPAWIQDFRLQVHATSAPFTAASGALHGGYLARFHSFSLEARACNTAGQCGMVRTGGWIDFGNLEISGYGSLPLPGEEEAVSDLGRRRIHYFYQDYAQRRDSRFGASYFWYGRHQPNSPVANVPLKPVLIAVSTMDATVNVDPARLHELLFFCPGHDCNKNDSTIQAHVVQFTVPAAYAGADGRVNLAAYTNRHGELVTGCTTISLDCVPLRIENAPATSGAIQHRDDTHLVDHPEDGYDDFDTSPPGQWWIGYPN